MKADMLTISLICYHLNFLKPMKVSLVLKIDQLRVLLDFWGLLIPN